MIAASIAQAEPPPAQPEGPPASPPPEAPAFGVPQQASPPALDSRIQSVEYREDQVVPIQVAPGYQLMVEFAADERIESVAVGDSGAWQVTPNHSGDRIFIKPIQSLASNLTVITSARTYTFDLSPGGAAGPYVLRFTYPGADETAEADPAGEVEGRYRLSGARALRPSRISDDGVHTYIEWPRDRALPAVYAVDERGQEAIVNGMMRDDLFVIDAIARRLVFRIDRDVARAERVEERARPLMARRKTETDPRTEAAPPGEASEASVKPVVPLPRGGPSPLFFVIGIAVAAVLLFSVLDARRRSLTAPSTRERAADRIALAAPPPPLYVPPAPPPAPLLINPVVARVEPAPLPPPPAPRIIYVPQPVPVPAPPQPEVAPPPQRSGSSPALVYDAGAPPAAAGEGAPAGATAEAAANIPSPTGSAVAGTRTRAGVLANRSTTVAQGTVVPAVLETALDSTRAGLARAIVSRDVRGFDGTRVLIPRGSRLIGEYRSEVQPGQNRAMVNWFRLIRPDGTTISIGSPAGDPLGRAGIRARVNSHFFQRFAGAILQSALDIGVALAASSADNSGVLFIPGAFQGAAPQIVQQQQITPTLTVRPGTSISIFVARDLDFTGAGARR